MNQNDKGFFKNHADTIAIVAVNLTIAAIITSMWVSNTHRIDAANARTDQIYQVILEILKEGRK